MFAGPGSGPLLAAAAAWNELASELASSAASFGSVTSDLASGSWLGPTSAAMMAVASHYSTFLIGAAAQAEEAASQAGAAAAAFESALASTVQPAVVAANRALMQVLANTNFLGQNAPAIADIEAAYEQMWALDVSAMAGYHFDASAAAERLAPWRQILHALGASRAQSHSGPTKHHHHVGLFSSVAASSLSNELASALFGNQSGDGNSNPGPGNAGSQNVGAGNTGSHNIGFGNLGNANIGFGNTGSGDIGFGLTGDHQIGFGGFNSGSGNIGFGNSGTGNIGFFNSGTGNVGIGNSGSFNTGVLNSGTAINGAMNMNLWGPGLAGTGMAAPSPDASLLSSGNYVTGGMNAANFSSSVLNPSVANAAFNPGFATPDVISAAPASPSFASAPSPATVSTPTYDIGTPNPVVSAASGQYATTPLLRAAAPTGFFSSGGNDAGARSTAATTTSDAGVGNSGSGGIPSSDFYKNDRNPTVPDLASTRPGPSE
jgi:PPE-repeat protein